MEKGDVYLCMFARVCMTFNIFNGVPARIKNNAGSRLYIFCLRSTKQC